MGQLSAIVEPKEFSVDYFFLNINGLTNKEDIEDAITDINEEALEMYVSVSYISDENQKASFIRSLISVPDKLLLFLAGTSYVGEVADNLVVSKNLIKKKLDQTGIIFIVKQGKTLYSIYKQAQDIISMALGKPSLAVPNKKLIIPR